MEPIKIADFSATIDKIQSLKSGGWRIAFDSGVHDIESYVSLSEASLATGISYRVIVIAGDGKEAAQRREL